jgi:predicted SAM-dependent methyltransferase
VAELGCGDKKLFDWSTGIDAIPMGNEIAGLSRGRLSLADVTANVEEELPIKDYDTIIAQHVLEHTVDALGAVLSWKNALKHGGRLIIAVPDQRVRNTIPMNWEHRHAWTPDSLKRFMETACGMKTINMLDPKNYVSLIGVFEKNGS